MNKAQRLSTLVCLASLAGTAAMAGPHEHGVARLDVALDGSTVTLALNSPLDNFLGFERAPRNDRERAAAQALLAQLQQGAALFKLDAAAQCGQRSAEVHAPVLGVGSAAAADKGAKAKSSDHADVEVTYSFQCTQPQALNTLTVALFESWQRLRRVEVQVVGPKGQNAVTLRRPASAVKLAR